jgi:hypothetical protein
MQVNMFISIREILMFNKIQPEIIHPRYRQVTERDYERKNKEIVKENMQRQIFLTADLFELIEKSSEIFF